MEQKTTIFNYIGQFFMTYGIIVTIFIVATLLVGDTAKNISSLYSFGSQGLSLATLVQHLALAGIITLVRVAFLTDCWIKSMNMVLRYTLFFVAICVVIGVFSALFMWFPVNNIMAWVFFIISFIICTVISVLIFKLTEKAENKKMEQALEEIKKQD